MTIYAQALPQAFGSQPLMGSTLVRATEVRCYERGQPAFSVAIEESPQLTRLPAPICGLSMDRPRLLGILNVTPDSCSDDGTLITVHSAVARAREMAEPVDVLDRGG